MESSDHTVVDAALGQLSRQTTTEDRLRVLQQLVEYWHGPIAPEDGMTDEDLKDLRLPYPLRWWYRWAGNRSEIMSGQNFLFTPKEDRYRFRKLRIEAGRLLFYIENQGVYQWATLPDGEDPPVFGRYEDSDPWEQEEIRLSEHLILTCLFEAVLGHSSFGASTSWLERSIFTEITSALSPVSIGSWRWPSGRTRFYVGGGAFMYATEMDVSCGAGYSVWFGAKTEAPLQFLKPYLDESWEYIGV